MQYLGANVPQAWAAATHAVLVYLAELDFLGVVPGGTTPDDDLGS